MAGTVAALLGRASLVVASDGPLLWDAVRLNIPAEPLFAKELPDSALDYVLSPRLARAPASWQQLLESYIQRKPSVDTLGARWEDDSGAAAASDMRITRGVVELAGRRLRKLHRDPRAFVKDSRVFGFLSWPSW